MRRSIESIEIQWYQKPTWLWIFLPLVPLFIAIANGRRWWLSRLAKPLSVPVVVVGNITLGGTGKTPLLICLVKFLTAQGLKPGVVSRGYGGAHRQGTLVVDSTTDPQLCGDEPALIVQSCSCPLIIGRDRQAAAQRLIDEFACNVVLSDDGLQHYRLARQLEIVVLDAERGLGNGWCLPLGPLRETSARLNEVDWVLTNGAAGDYGFTLAPQGWRSVRTTVLHPLKPYPWIASGALTPVYAIAGIGHPQRFFNSVAQQQVITQNASFPDHWGYTPADLAFAGDNPLLMTSKDAVKCRAFASSNWWALEVVAQVSPAFLQEFWLRLQQLNVSTVEDE